MGISAFCFFKTTIDLNQYIFLDIKEIKNKCLDYIKHNPIYHYSESSKKYYINFKETTLHNSNINLEYIMYKRYEIKFIFTLNNGNSPYSFLPDEFESFYKKYVKNNKMKYEIEYI
jgi:alpha-L-arabinofuranosidase